MSTIRIIEAADPLDDHLEQFKQYASVPDDSRDGMLLRILKRAMLAVQESADTAVLPCVLELTAHDVKAGEALRLYQGGAAVESVTDGQGNALAYRAERDRVVLEESAPTAVVTYSNEVSTPDADRLQPVCWELATAIYDGEDASVQAGILKKTYFAL